MAHRSWLHLQARVAGLALPRDLAARDGRAAVDVGWAEQMLPFIEMFTAEGEVVLDPFAGLGTTLVAAAHLGRRALGVELSAARAALATERLRRLGHDALEVCPGDATALPFDDQAAHLVLTNVPYFEGGAARGPGPDDAAQVYALSGYDAYRARMDAVVDEAWRVLPPGGRVVFMAQNVTRHGRLVPQAWDWGAALARRFVLKEERVLVYDRPVPDDGDVWRTNRAHEYALCGEKAPGPARADLDEVWATLAPAGLDPVLIGSWAARLDGGARVPHDIDLLVAPDLDRVRRGLALLDEAGYALFSWGTPIGPAVADEVLRGRHYVRAVRDHVIVDLTYECAALPHAAARPGAAHTGPVVFAAAAQRAVLDEARARERAQSPQ